MIYSDYAETIFFIKNDSDYVSFYDVWLLNSANSDNIIFKTELVVGNKDRASITIPVFDIEPDQLETYRVCVQEKITQESGRWGVVGRICAKVRFYWPRSQLQALQLQ
ncbi:hypothetical protein MD535_24725 [Vibrio sp. ZSDZ65]|uniref:Uncharacterized protein n=1 Tax=Vibrio qingdaonensis TaxID=2829491 RepID=A0A9X3CTI0_9VIBR|nr:hypothetical protein [Vibrio qingdaonensis]MCW8349195.1 hypothetical protein [Vibrio qingdaonensis]